MLTSTQQFDLIYDVGETLLENGAEIKRVESTIAHLATSFQLTDFNSFVMINGIFLTYRSDSGLVQAKVQDIPISPISLAKIDAINSLSRQLAEGRLTDDEFQQAFSAIKAKRYTSLRLKFVGYAIGSASFSIIFGGAWVESAFAMLFGILIAAYTLVILPHFHLSKITIDISSSMLVSIVACTLKLLMPSLLLNSLIIGGVISLVPGVSLVNGIRYLFDQDYTSGWDQLIDAVVTSLCLSIGTGSILTLYRLFT